MSNLSTKQRDALPASAFGWPEKRLYPVVDASDVMAAAHLIGKAPKDKQAAIKARIKEIAKRKGFPLPKMWE